MVTRKPVMALITMSILMAFAGGPVFAADTMSKPATTLASTYSSFAGSDANASALVNGLRTGKSITLTSASGTTGTTTTAPTTFTPATSKLGYGNVNIALSLAQAELTKLGITNPTPAQLQTALNGGIITTATGTTPLPGVLQMRSDGQGWGAIAKSRGFNLGEVVSASKTDKSASASERRADADKGKSVAKADKINAGRQEAVERQAKVERLEKIERPEKVQRPEKIERPERVERPEKVSRPEKIERPERVEQSKR